MNTIVLCIHWCNYTKHGSRVPCDWSIYKCAALHAKCVICTKHTVQMVWNFQFLCKYNLVSYLFETPIELVGIDADVFQSLR